MILSIFLAKLLGLYMLTIAISWLIRKDQVTASIKEVATSKGLMVVSGIMGIMFGLAIAIAHPIWQLNWMGLITLLGYIMIIRGIIVFVATEKIQRYTLNAIEKHYWLMIALLIVIGIFLTYSGFMAG